MMPMETPEEKARKRIDKQLNDAGWEIVPRDEYVPHDTQAVKEALMLGNKESDYLLFVEDKAIAVVEAKREENPLGDDVVRQAENYAVTPRDWFGLWFQGLIPLVYLANGKKIYFKNMLDSDSDYVELSAMHSFCAKSFSGMVDPAYIALVCRTDLVRMQVDPLIKTTAGQNTISQGNLGKTIIPLPPLAEQKRIVERVNNLLQALPDSEN